MGSPAVVPRGLCRCGCGEQTTLSPYSVPARGYVKGEPRPFVAGHQHRRYDAYEEQDCGYDTPCWVWQLYKDRLGYAKVTVSGKKLAAHRFHYERHKGSIPDGLSLDHLCRNPSCVNPDHLEPVTHAENVRRGVHTRLSVEDVAQIRASFAHKTPLELAERYGVTRQLIYRIRLGKVWSDVPAAELAA